MGMGGLTGHEAHLAAEAEEAARVAAEAAAAEAEEQAKKKKRKKRKKKGRKPEVVRKYHPELLALVREFRDRFLERANTEEGSWLLSDACGKYDVSRGLLPGAGARDVGMLQGPSLALPGKVAAVDDDDDVIDVDYEVRDAA